MVMFYPAEGCRCGHCHAAPPAGAYPEGPDYAPEDGPLPRIHPALAQVGLAAATARATRPARTRPTSRFVPWPKARPTGPVAAASPAVPSVRYSRPGGAGVQGGRSACQL